MHRFPDCHHWLSAAYIHLYGRNAQLHLVSTTFPVQQSAGYFQGVTGCQILITQEHVTD